MFLLRLCVFRPNNHFIHLHKEIQRQKRGGGGGRMRVSSSHFNVVAFLRGTALDVTLHSVSAEFPSLRSAEGFNEPKVVGVFFFLLPLNKIPYTCTYVANGFGPLIPFSARRLDNITS